MLSPAATRSLVALALASGLALETGCANIGQRAPEVSETVVSTARVTAKRPGVSGAFEAKGTHLSVRVAASCDVFEEQDVRIESRRENFNEQPGVDIRAGVIGGILAGVGTGFLIDSAKVAPNDQRSRTYNPFGPNVAKGVGAGGVAAGGVAIVLGQGPTANAGATDGAGRAEVDLVSVVPVEWTKSPRAPRIAVTAGGVLLGDFDAEPVHQMHEDLEWAKVDKAACANPTSVTSCDGVEAYRTSFPRSRHLPEAEQLLIAAGPGLARARDDSEWAGSAVATCKVALLVEGCDGVRTYLARRPQGRHAKEAEAILRKADPKLKALERKLDADRRAHGPGSVDPCKPQCTDVGLSCAATCGPDRDACIDKCASLAHACEGRCR